MGKRTQDEIQQKLVELEVAMKQEQAVKAAQEDMEDAELISDEADTVSTAMSRIEQSIKNKEKKRQKKGEVVKADAGMADLYQYGAYGCFGVGGFMLMTHIYVSFWGGLFSGTTGLLMLPLLAGIGMLIYNYKSKVAQALTAGTFGILIINIISSIRLGLYGSNLLDLILLMLPIVAGVVLLAKANVARRAEKSEDLKLLK